MLYHLRRHLRNLYDLPSSPDTWNKIALGLPQYLLLGRKRQRDGYQGEQLVIGVGQFPMRPADTQGFGVALKLTFAGNNQLTHMSTYIFGVVVVGCILVQMVRLTPD